MLLLLLHGALADTCSAYLDLEHLSTLDEVPELAESSGLAVSRARGVLYTHPDSGADADIIAFEADGTARGAHRLEGGGFQDWEDLSLGPCHDDPARDCLYIGDIGDNPRTRASIQVYEAREPAEDGEPLMVIATWNVTYPEGPRDAEALAVHPRSGRIYLATKDMSGDEEIFVLPETPTGADTTAEMTQITRFFLDTGYDRLVTGADWDPDGERFVLRTYLSAVEWAADPEAPDLTWEGEPTAWPVDGQGQGEAIAYEREASGLLLTSEGSPMPLDRLPCADDVAPADSGETSETGEASVNPLPEDEGCGCAAGGRPGALLAVWLSALLAARRTSARRPGSGRRSCRARDR